MNENETNTEQRTHAHTNNECDVDQIGICGE